MVSAVKSVNCAPMHLRCAACGQTHLRDGYCQALDPDSLWHEGALGTKWKSCLATRPLLDAKVYAAPVPLGGVTLPVTPEPDVTPDLSVTEHVSVTCVECGEVFESRRATAQFCSPTCRQRAHRRR